MFAAIKKYVPCLVKIYIHKITVLVMYFSWGFLLLTRRYHCGLDSFSLLRRTAQLSEAAQEYEEDEVSTREC